MTIREVLDKYRNLIGDTVAEELEADLIAREDEIADHIRNAGAQLGAMPEFVAEALCVVGLGTQPDEATRNYIHTQFEGAVHRVNEMIRRQRGDESGT